MSILVHTAGSNLAESWQSLLPDPGQERRGGMPDRAPYGRCKNSFAERLSGSIWKLMSWLLNLHLYVLIYLAPAGTAGWPQVIATALQKLGVSFLKS